MYKGLKGLRQKIHGAVDKVRSKVRSTARPGGLRDRIHSFRDKVHSRVGEKIDQKVSQFRERHPNAPDLGIYSRFQERHPHMFTQSQTLADQSSHIASSGQSAVDYNQSNVGAAAVANDIKMQDTGSALSKKKRKRAKPFKMKRKY